MSYGIRAGLVTENAAILELIFQGVRNGQPVRLASDPREADQAMTRLRRIFKATELLYDECGGRYLNLGPQVKLRLEIAHGRGGVPIASILCTPRDAAGPAWQPAEDASELDTQTAGLTLLAGASTVLRFRSEAGLTGLSERLAVLGWQESSREAFDDGSVWINVARVQRSGALAALGFGARKAGGEE